MSPPSFRQALVIANPISGQGLAVQLATDLAAGLEASGIPTELHHTTGPGDGRTRVSTWDGELDLVVSVGGDGTVREVLSGLRVHPASEPRPRVGVLPMGTGNALCADLGLPRDARGALEVLLGGKTVELDVADVNGELCFLITGVGPDAAVVAEVDRRRAKRVLRKWHYLPAGCRALLAHRPAPLSVELDGEPLSGTYSQVMASNLIHYGGLVRLCPGRVLGDGLFEIFLFRGHRRRHLLFYALRFFLRAIPGGSVEMRRAARVRVTSATPVPYHVDGDPMGVTPVDLRVTHERFQLLVP